MAFGFYSDPALTTAITGRLSFVQSSDVPVAQDKVVYFGNPLDDGSSVTPDSGSSITVTPTGTAAADVRLALSRAGLATATGGAALNIGAEVLAGVADAVAIFVRVLDSTGTVCVNTSISLETSEVIVNV